MKTYLVLVLSIGAVGLAALGCGSEAQVSKPLWQDRGVPASLSEVKEETNEAARILAGQFGLQVANPLTSFTVDKEHAKKDLPSFIVRITYDDAFELIEIVLQPPQETWQSFNDAERRTGSFLRSLGVEPCNMFIVWTPEDLDMFVTKAGQYPESLEYFCREEGHPSFTAPIS